MYQLLFPNEAFAAAFVTTKATFQSTIPLSLNHKIPKSLLSIS